MPSKMTRTQKATVWTFEEHEVIAALRAHFDIPANARLSILGTAKGPGCCADATPERVLHVAHYE